eukprot:7066425-Alexandrium_andersonii.AAC.1
MSASLVGSEMCIRDRLPPPRSPPACFVITVADSERKMVPNHADEALQGGTVEAVPGSAQLKLRTLEAMCSH